MKRDFFFTNDTPAKRHHLFTLLQVVVVISSQPKLISFMYRLSILLLDFFSNRYSAALHEYSNAIWETDSVRRAMS